MDGCVEWVAVAVPLLVHGASLRRAINAPLQHFVYRIGRKEEKQHVEQLHPVWASQELVAGQDTWHLSVSLRHSPQACLGFVEPSRSRQTLRFQRQSKPHAVSDDFHFKCSKNAADSVRFQKHVVHSKPYRPTPRLCTGNRLDPSTSNRTSAKPEVTLVRSQK
jgi:hypothetical protein